MFERTRIITEDEEVKIILRVGLVLKTPVAANEMTIMRIMERRRRETLKIVMIALALLTNRLRCFLSSAKISRFCTSQL